MACPYRRAPRPRADRPREVRRLVAPTAFETGFHVQLIDFGRTFEVGPRHIQHSQEALDAPIDFL